MKNEPENKQERIAPSRTARVTFTVRVVVKK
jgi:hypothetical protein